MSFTQEGDVEITETEDISPPAREDVSLNPEVDGLRQRAHVLSNYELLPLKKRTFSVFFVFRFCVPALLASALRFQAPLLVYSIRHETIYDVSQRAAFFFLSAPSKQTF